MKGELKQNNKSNITLSVDSPILKELQNDSKIAGVSTNSKINSILTKHVLFYRYAELQEMMIIPPKIFAAMFEVVDEGKMVDLLNHVAIDTMPSVFAHNNIVPTIDNLIKYCFEGIFLWGGMCSSFRHYVNEQGYRCLVLEHKYGIKWSTKIFECKPV
ncbi:MAG: hypothetical protein HY222_06155 [Thaumarchaeota archaeon]|nr:hypothetical protein [Nitrososphaerota archaeon]MBI3641959.1 hypothetical protein [Nitrososphaerota archaeon]